MLVYIPTVSLIGIQFFLSALLLKAIRRSANKQQIVIMASIAITLTLWTVVNTVLLADYTRATDVSLLNKFNAAGFFLGSLAVLEIYVFSYYFPVQRNIRSKSSLFLLLLGTILCFASLIPNFSGRYSYNYVEQNIVYANGMFYLLYIVNILLFLGNFLFNMYVSSPKDLRIKSQRDLIGAGLAATTSIALVFIIILPLLFGERTLFYVIGYSSPLFFTLLATVAILKHRLFDIKIFIFRAVSYIGLLVVLVLFYVLFGLQLSKLLVSQTSNQFVGDVVIFVNSLLLILFFAPLKNYFNKVTNKFFFQDSYDPQSFLGELNRTLVTDAEIESLLNKASTVIQENLKATFCTFYIRETSYFPDRFIGSQRENSGIGNLERINEISKKLHKKVYSIEQDTDNDDEKELSSDLKKKDIEVMARLVSTLDYEVNGIGYIFLGPKMNGNLYTAADLKILEIIANELVIAVENVLRFEEIEQFNVTLQKKIDDATKELQASNEKLKALDEAKDEFVSMASHQLRTPLTSIKGYLSMVVEGDAGEVNPTQKQMLGQALFSSQRMVYLISDLLNVSRLKTGKFVIEAKPTSLPEVVETELNQLYDGANAKNITLSFDKPAKFPMLNLDEMKIRQVIMNFTDNAIYYTPTGGKITVALRDKKDSIEFTVKDTGIGVPKAERHKLFAKFYRAENARKARPDGTGLGLFMAKKVIVAQGGSILFDSKEGKGSTFGFNFPKKHLEIKG